MCVIRQAQSTHNKKFAYLHYLQKNVGGDVDFLPADKDESFLQKGDSITLGVGSKA